MTVTTNQMLDVAQDTLLNAFMQTAECDNKKLKEKVTNRKKLETRRAIEDYLETRRMRKAFDEYDFED